MKTKHTLIKILSLLNGVYGRKQDNYKNAEQHYPEHKEELAYLKGRLEEADDIRDKITRLIIEELEGGDTP